MLPKRNNRFVRLIILVLVFSLISGCGPNIERLRDQGDVEGLLEVIDAEDDPAVKAAAVKALGEMKNPKTYENIILYLKDEQEIVRTEAKNTLVDLGFQVVEPLIAKLDSDDYILRKEVIAILIEIGQPAAYYLIKALSNENENTKSGAYESLIAIGEPVIPDLIDALSEARSDKELDLIDDLTEIVNEHYDCSVSYLVESLTDTNPLNRENAVKTLGSLKSIDAIPSLISTLSDEESAVKWATIDALENIGLPAVEQLLASYKHDDEQSKGKLENILRSIYETQEDKIIDYARRVCKGEAVQDVSDYKQSGTIHPLVIFYTPSENLLWSGYIPVDWLPYTPEKLELVICVEIQDRTIEKCKYIATTNTISRISRNTTVILREAFTGLEIDRTKFYGSDPDKQCPSRTSTFRDIYGEDNFEFSDLEKWLSGLNIN